MYLETPVVAINSGGPLESIADGKTGFLLEKDPRKWAAVFKRIENEPGLK
jgi:alpha-1,3/alpha-1,6-mannosyltransferase